MASMLAIGTGFGVFLLETTVAARAVRVRSDLLQHRVFDLAPWIFLWFPADVWAVQPDVKGWRIPAVFTGQRWTGVERTGVEQASVARAP